MEARTARLVQAGLGVVLVAVLAWVFTYDGGGDPPPLPGPIETVSPRDGAQSPRQQPVVVDLAVGYEAELFVQDRASGAWVPITDTTFEPATGVLSWTPPDDIAPSGQFRLKVEYRSVSGLPESGAYEWSIRTY